MVNIRRVCAPPSFELVDGRVEEVLAAEPPASYQAALCDPPYGLGMYGAAWDQELPGAGAWAALCRVLEPGAWALAFGHPRTHHRLMAAMEEGGLELRDVLLWLFGTGMPKGRTTVKPAWQPVVLARRPGPVRELNVDGCRTLGVVLPRDRRSSPRGRRTFWRGEGRRREGERHDPRGRWPANLMLGHGPGCGPQGCERGCPVELLGGEEGVPRFFYCAKPAGREVSGNPHPTRKPVGLTEELARLLLVEGGKRLAVPFCGSGSELVGGARAGWRELRGVEAEARWLRVAKTRLLGEGARWRR